jgi:class 3 adenylate cyclase
MEPRIQYARTADGVSIAFYTLGDGMPLVYLPNIPLGHIQMEWQFPESRRWYERLAEKRKLVRYDGRGWGLSERDVTDYSLDVLMLDLEAVVDRLSLERFALLGVLQMGPVAIAYAARNPERVSHLVLWCSWARASVFYTSPRLRALRELLEKDWELYTETAGHVLLGWSQGSPAHRAAELYRESVTRQALRATVAALREFDVTDLLPRVRAPTLVVHRRGVRLFDVDVASHLASHIPDARLLLQQGDILSPWLGDMEAVASVIDEFLGEGEQAPAARAAPSREPGGLVTILFTDVEGSTALTQRLGDARARDVLREHERIVREALQAHGGAEVKALGDGFMASFGSATRALECAIAMQRAFAAHSESAKEPIRVRVGLNAGEPIAEAEDLFGTAVNLAARIAAQAQGGEIMASDVVRQLVAGKGFLFADRGEVALRGFEDPVRLYEVRWREEG